MKLLGVPGKGALIWWRYNTFSPKTYPRCSLVDFFLSLQIEHWPRGATSGASSNSAAKDDRFDAAMTKFTGDSTKGTTLPLDHANSWSVGQFGHQLQSFHCPSTKTFMATQIAFTPSLCTSKFSSRLCSGCNKQVKCDPQKFFHDNNNTPEQRSRINQVNYVKISLYQLSCISFCFFCIKNDLQLWEEVRSEIHFLKAETAQGAGLIGIPKSEVQRWNI